MLRDFLQALRLSSYPVHIGFLLMSGFADTGQMAA